MIPSHIIASGKGGTDGFVLQACYCRNEVHGDDLVLREHSAKLEHNYGAALKAGVVQQPQKQMQQQPSTTPACPVNESVSRRRTFFWPISTAVSTRKSSRDR